MYYATDASPKFHPAFIFKEKKKWINKQTNFKKKLVCHTFVSRHIFSWLRISGGRRHVTLWKWVTCTTRNVELIKLSTEWKRKKNSPAFISSDLKGKCSFFPSSVYFRKTLDRIPVVVFVSGPNVIIFIL